ncbi:lipocalin family protein [Flavobacterium sp.]|uniref:lipocalin family protein n=1 Tax=Flavobacterium sp. TaxID=239 RepID=UPI002B4B3231|nr:lipocalin family protein [Flavobacterium sp.]HLF51997.1 lipocalin family protein [Flavobacterium sp.]
MNKIYTLLFLLILTSCHQKVSEKDISKLNGYWEIEKVILPNGNEKKYTINETFDYFQIKANKGFRKKVKPLLNGRFEVDEQSEKVEIVFEKDKTYMVYTTPYAKWKEELQSLSDEKMVIVNTAKAEYHYKKAIPINLLGDGKKTK